MSAGTIFTEIDLDSRKFDAAQKRILYDAKTMAINVEDAWKNLGQKSDVMYNAMRQQATNAFERIKGDAKSSSAEIIRAEEAKNAKLKALNEEQYGAQTSLIDSLKKNWMALSAAVIGVYYSVVKFYDLAERGAKVGAVEESFTSMTRNFSVAGDELIKKLEEVTKGTVDNSDLMIKALRLISEGFSEKQIIGIGEAARISARLTGKTVSEAYEQISDSMINLRERGLKSAGIIIDMDKAESKHAATLGVTKEQLSDYGRRMAWAGAIMEKTKEDAAKLGDSLDKLNEYEKFQKWSATWKEFGDTMSKFAAKIGEKIVPEITGLFNSILKLIELGERIGKGENIAEAISKTVGNREAYLKARMELGWLRSGELEELQRLQTPKLSQPAIGITGTQGKGIDQIKIDPFAVLYGMTEAEFKDRMSFSKLMFDAWKEDYGLIPPSFQDLYGMTEEELKERMSFSNLMGESWKEDYGIIPPSFEDLYGMTEEELKERMSYSKLMAEEWKQGYIDPPSFEDLYGMTEDEFKDRMSFSKLAYEGWLEGYTKLNEIPEFIKGLGNTISSSVSGAMSSMIMGTQSAAEALKQIWSSIASYVIEQIAKMMVEWLLFQKTTSGGGTSGLNLLGTIGSLVGLGGVPSGGPSGGGYSGGYSPSYASGGNAGQNAMRSGGSVQVDNSKTTMNIYALDVDSFEKKYGNSIMKINRKSYRLAGDMKNMTR